MKKLYPILALITVFNIQSKAQNLSTLQNDIASRLNQKYNEEYLVLLASSVKELSKSSFIDELILDKYNTLNGKKIFLAHSKSKEGSPTPLGIFGIFEGNIIWDSGPIVSPYALSGYDVYSIDDINRDGLIDITTSWIRGNDSHIQEFWIFSWNGSSGEVISEIKTDNTSGISFRRGTVKFVDSNLDA